MIVDLLLTPLIAVVEWMVGLLPSGEHLDLPAMDSFTALIAKVNSVLPIAPVIQVAVVVLGALVVFVLVRAALLVWNLIWP